VTAETPELDDAVAAVVAFAQCALPTAVVRGVWRRG
jgi:hypothetical protein